MSTEEEKRRAREKQRKWRAENSEKVKERNHQLYILNKDKKTEQAKQYRLKHPERMATASKKFYQTHKDRYTEWYMKDREKRCQTRKDYNQTIKGRYVAYQGSARTRNLLFDLSLEEFAEFWQQPCFYCGGAIATVGLDRINNNEGYVMSNVVACCSMCNSAKGTRTFEEFMDYCQRMANYWNPITRQIGKITYGK